MNIVELDKRHAAVHEAGHAVVGVVLGIHGSADLHRDPDGGPRHNHWVGQYHHVGHIPGGPVPRGALAYAGSVAEMMDGEEYGDDLIPEDIAWQVSDVLWVDEMSPTDAAYLPDDDQKRYDSLVMAVRILREQRVLHAAVVDVLLRHEEISGDDLHGLAESLMVPAAV